MTIQSNFKIECLSIILSHTSITSTTIRVQIFNRSIIMSTNHHLPEVVEKVDFAALSPSSNQVVYAELIVLKGLKFIQHLS